MPYFVKHSKHKTQIKQLVNSQKTSYISHSEMSYLASLVRIMYKIENGYAVCFTSGSNPWSGALYITANMTTNCS